MKTKYWSYWYVVTEKLKFAKYNHIIWQKYWNNHNKLRSNFHNTTNLTIEKLQIYRQNCDAFPKPKLPNTAAKQFPRNRQQDYLKQYKEIVISRNSMGNKECCLFSPDERTDNNYL